MQRVAIIDYGMGNSRSIANMFDKAGADAVIASRPAELEGADRLVLPGVGSFDRAMRRLRSDGWERVLTPLVKTHKVPILGICLGMHLMTQGSDEGEEPGLAWVSGRAVRFDTSRAPITVPNMGWRRVQPSMPSGLLADADEWTRFYFAHAYHCVGIHRESIIGMAEHGYEFCAAFQVGNIYATQFHPEKSHGHGYSVVLNFLEGRGADAGVERRIDRDATFAARNEQLARARLIPVLLLRGTGLVKTRQFRKPVYLGDPINILRIFNEKEADEVVVLDIDATLNGRGPNLDVLEDMATEAFMPLACGGGVADYATIERLVSMGFEKVVVNTRAVEDPDWLAGAAREFGSSTLVVSIDVRSSWLRGPRVHTRAGRRRVDGTPVEVARRVVAAGAGEIMVNSIERDGEMAGYDLDLTRSIAEAVSVPVIACGGAGGVQHLRSAVIEGDAAAAAAGSMFVFHGRHRAVLINMPRRRDFEAASETDRTHVN